MHRAGEFVAQGVVDKALAFHTVIFGEDFGDDFHAKMGFSLGAGAHMPGVKMRFIYHIQRMRRERLTQFGLNIMRYRHTDFPSDTRLSRGNRTIRRKRHVLAWLFQGDHTAEMVKESLTNGTVLDNPSDGKTNGGPDNGPAEPVVAVCNHPECTLPGEYRAPRSRTELTNFYWFCLEHVREYNAAWNYYADMDDAAVEAEIRKDIVWQRPTWPLGTRPGANGPQFHDPLSLLGEGAMDPRSAREAEVQMQNLTPREREAVSVLGLVAPFTKADIKQRYKLLAKSLHPDANGGDKRAEDRLKSVNHAYTTLKDSERLT